MDEVEELNAKLANALKGEASLNRTFIKLKRKSDVQTREIERLKAKIKALQEHGQRMHQRWRDAERAVEPNK